MAKKSSIEKNKRRRRLTKEGAPKRARLKGWQVFVFSALGVVGLALGTILLIAVSGLTHSS